MEQSLCAFGLTAGLGWVSPQELMYYVLSVQIRGVVA